MSRTATFWKNGLRRLLGSSSKFNLGPYRRRLARIDDLGRTLAQVSDQALTESAAALRVAVEEGCGLDEVAEELFAVAREAAWRTLGQRPYDEQMLAGMAMLEGNVAEMQTGEGKTLAAVAPVALAAMAGNGAHVLTFNDYLARRDAQWMGPAYRFLGLEVAHVAEGMSMAERRRAYAADITYLTAKEAGFDFLRDQLCLDPDHVVHRGLNFALVDEADSILVDEARIPLVIAGRAEAAHTSAEDMAKLAQTLVPSLDFATDEQERNVFLTDRGARRAEQELGRGILYDSANVGLLADLCNALHAEHLIQRDVDYIVRDGRVELVDDFTGRVAERRQWPDGLQAAIEAKERVQLGSEGQILGSVTMQHFLTNYDRLAGMTATAQPAAEELAELYGLETVVVTPHTPCRRIDHPDSVFTHSEAKQAALVEEIRSSHDSGRPVLVGTASVAESEALAGALRRAGVEVEVLNAKNDAAEAEIVAAAGDLGAVTISTNMAGRGTDIRLGGADQIHRPEVLALGGLYVIGTNRHESRRVDLQLRGRAGRQGDPGDSRFFISLEDPLAVRYGVRELIPDRHLPPPRPEPVDNPVVGREINRVQRIVEGETLDIRRRLCRYSTLIEDQRRAVQGPRQEILNRVRKPEILSQRCPQKWQELSRMAGQEQLLELETRLTLLAMDRCWADHLALTRRIRDQIHVVSFVGKDPLTEFTRELGTAFADLQELVDEEVVARFEKLQITDAGIDWSDDGLLGPSSTWTYLINDAPFGQNPLRSIANRSSLGAAAAVFAGPFLLLWGLLLHWKRRRLDSG